MSRHAIAPRDGGRLFSFWTVMLDLDTAEYLTIPDLLKAFPREEGGRRVLYMEAANQSMDYQNEVVLGKALADSADYFLRYGNFDLDHITQLGPKMGIPGYASYEIGRPEEVKVDGSRTFVKGFVYAGDAPVAEQANIFWDSLTKTVPPHRWYPSVGGGVRDKGAEFDPKTQTSRTVIRSVRWTNIGFSKTPVNPDVPSVSTIPFGVLAKSWGMAGLDMAKTLTAGYGTDSATLTGGAALRTQSLDRRVSSYFDFRDRIAGDIRAKRVQPSASALVEHAAAQYGLDRADASEWTERFMGDLKTALTHKLKDTH